MVDDSNNIQHVRAQGREARKLNDDDSSTMILPQDCPYGPGENRDAWLEAYHAPKEEVLQADTSKPTTQDVRRDAPPETVRKGAKPRRSGGKPRRSGGKGKRGKPAPPATKVSTETTGTGETALKTKAGDADPTQLDRPSLTNVVGDPAAAEGDRTAANPKAADNQPGAAEKLM